MAVFDYGKKKNPWFKLLPGGLKNQGFEKSRFYCMLH